MDGTLSQGWGRCNLWEVWVMRIFLSRSSRSRDELSRPVFNGDAKFVSVCLFKFVTNRIACPSSLGRLCFCIVSAQPLLIFLHGADIVRTPDSLNPWHFSERPPSLLQWASTARFFPLPPALLPLALLTIFTWNVSELLIRPPLSFPLFSWGHYT